MKSKFSTAVVCCSLLLATPVFAGQADATADGTWDCVDNKNAAAGAIVIVDTNYAFIQVDGETAYGKLYRLDDEFGEAPAFVVVSGYLKDQLASQGVALAGPHGHEMDVSGELFLRIIITPDNKLYCTRRKAPAA